MLKNQSGKIMYFHAWPEWPRGWCAVHSDWPSPFLLTQMVESPTCHSQKAASGRGRLQSSLGLEHLPGRHRHESSWGPGKAHMMVLLHNSLLETESASQQLSEIGWLARRIRVHVPIHTPASSVNWTDKYKGRFWFTFLLWSSCADLGPIK